MCRMVGVVFRDQFPREVLRDLREVSRVGRIPGKEKVGHREGWGIASFIDGSPSYLGRSPNWAAGDASYENALASASALAGPNIVIGHVRASSRGEARLANTHPFIVDEIVLGHNGTVTGFNPATERRPEGETDSELLALALADQYKLEHDLRVALKSVILEDVDGREFTGAVLLASDGKTLCGYRDYSENGAYYNLRLAATEDHVTLFQETIDGYAGSVSQIGRRELVSIGLDLVVRRETLR